MSEALEFEGQEITGFTVAIPAVKLEADESYQRGTYLDLQVRVRVRSARFEETRSGDLQKVHVMAIESVGIAGVTTPQQYRAQVEAEEAAALAAAEAEPEAEATGADDEGETEPWDAGYPQGTPEPVAVGS